MRRHRLCLLLGADLGAPQRGWAASSNVYAGPCGNESTAPRTQAFTVAVNTKLTDAHIINSTAPGPFRVEISRVSTEFKLTGSAMVVRCVSVWRESLPPPVREAPNPENRLAKGGQYGFCNGPWLVNPFLRRPIAGGVLLSGVGAWPPPDGIRGGRVDQSTVAWS
jgi:hypothetical protein